MAGVSAGKTAAPGIAGSIRPDTRRGSLRLGHRRLASACGPRATDDTVRGGERRGLIRRAGEERRMEDELRDASRVDRRGRPGTPRAAAPADGAVGAGGPGEGGGRDGGRGPRRRGPGPGRARGQAGGGRDLGGGDGVDLSRDPARARWSGSTGSGWRSGSGAAGASSSSAARAGWAPGCGAFWRLVGHRVDAVDPAWAGLPAEEGRWAALEAVPTLEPYDAVVLSVPLARMPEVLDAVTARRPRGARGGDRLDPVAPRAGAGRGPRRRACGPARCTRCSGPGRRPTSR